MEDILVPIFICVVLPVAIVLIISLSSMHTENKRTQVLLKAIEADNSIDADKLAQALAKPKKTPRELLNLRLMRGCFFSLAGIGLCVVGLLAKINGEAFGSDPVSIPLMFGGLGLAMGISYLIVYFATRKQVNGENADK